MGQQGGYWIDWVHNICWTKQNQECQSDNSDPTITLPSPLSSKIPAVFDWISPVHSSTPCYLSIFPFYYPPSTFGSCLRGKKSYCFIKSHGKLVTWYLKEEQHYLTNEVTFHISREQNYMVIKNINLCHTNNSIHDELLFANKSNKYSDIVH